MKKRTKVFRTMIAAAAAVTLLTITASASEWKQDNNGWWYEHDDGSYTTNSWETIDGKEYCFNPDGYMYSNAITPDGTLVAPSGEKRSMNQELISLLRSEADRGPEISIGSTMDPNTWEATYYSIIDRVAYYEAYGEVTAIKFFTLDLDDNSIGKIITLDGKQYRIIEKASGGTDGDWVIQPVDSETDVMRLYRQESRPNTYSLREYVEVPEIETIYTGPIYLSKDFKIADFMYESPKYDSTTDTLTYTWYSIPEAIRTEAESSRKWKLQRPKNYILTIGRVELQDVDQNGLLARLYQRKAG